MEGPAVLLACVHCCGDLAVDRQTNGLPPGSEANEWRWSSNSPGALVWPQVGWTRLDRGSASRSGSGAENVLLIELIGSSGLPLSNAVFRFVVVFSVLLYCEY